MVSDLPPEMIEMLWEGARDKLGIICRPGLVREKWLLLRHAEKLGFVRFLSVDVPWITAKGREAIGAPSEFEYDTDALRELSKRRPLKPSAKSDPRSDALYQVWKMEKKVCVLLVRQEDFRDNPGTVRVTNVGSKDPQYLSDKNSTIMEESEGRFVLAVVPAWLRKVAKMSAFPLPLPDGDEWTDEERALWGRMSDVCFSINSRIRNSGRRKKPYLRFGETA